jgi:iron complex transport system substrate-binding protein
VKSILIYILLLEVLFSCRENNKRVKEDTLADNTVVAADSVRFAQMFRIETFESYIRLIVINPWNTNKILKTFILVPKNIILPKNLPEGELIRTPLSRTVSFGSVQCSFFAEFEALETLVGVCEPQYLNIPFVHQAINEGKIADIGQAANPNLEKLMMIEPEAIFTAPIEEAVSERTKIVDIPTVECVDYMETSPLGRAEWLRFYALFFEKREIADSLFAETVEKYRTLQSLTANVEHHPTVFSETVYSGVWWLPGGNSYMAHFFKDAGANYIWKDDKHTGSIGLSFESVLENAENAEYWLVKYNSPYHLTKSQLAGENPNYALFNAYKNSNIYAVNTNKTLYYEELPIHPDNILRDLVMIFHKEILPDRSTKYFVKITE